MAERTEPRRSPLAVVRDVPRRLRTVALEQVDEARRDLMVRTRDTRVGFALLGVAAGLALATLTTLAVALTIALAQVLPWWGAILAVVAPLALATGILAAVGMRRISATAPRPDGDATGDAQRPARHAREASA